MNASIRFLKEDQQRDGSFLSLTSADSVNFRNATECQSVFSTALILSCLNALDDENNDTLKIIKKAAVNFLLSQKSAHWSFNYWARESKQSKAMPYPDDLDDTACALAALHEYDPSLIDGEVLAGMVTILAALESKEGGPYRTWLVPPDAKKGWLDIDLAVNSNVGYFLSRQDVKLKNIIKLVEAGISNRDYGSPYYPSVYPVIYFISRFYKGRKRAEVIDLLLKKQKNGNWGNPLNTALAALALLNFGVPAKSLDKSAAYLVKERRTDGSWYANPFYVGVNPLQSEGDKRAHFAGSSSLTTAFCIAAIHRISGNGAPNSPAKKFDQRGDEMYKRIIQRAKNTFSLLGDELKTQAEVWLKKTIRSDHNKEIVLFPYFFALSLERKLSQDHLQVIEDLGLTNLWGWMAYTIYDDFLDEEGDLQMLSVANVALRESYGTLLSVLPNTEFPDFVKLVFGQIDSANAWEIMHCRIKEKTIISALARPIPDFNNIAHLSDRSLGHALGPVAVLCVLGHRIDSEEVKNVFEGVRHYIAARQIHDDMHDWEGDLSRGRINSVSAAIFATIKNHKSVPGNNVEILLFLQREFWNNIVDFLCSRASAHLIQAQALFLTAGVSQNFIDMILNPLQKATEKTVKEKNNARKFISKYTDNK